MQSMIDSGIEPLYDMPTPAEGGIEVIVEDPESLEIGVDGMTISFGEDPEEVAHDANLAEHLDEDYLSRLGEEVLEDVEMDVQSRSEWISTYLEGLDTLGIGLEDRSNPWPGACGLTHPLLLEAAVRFQSETIMETFPPAGPILAKVIGGNLEDKQDVARRVQDDMNYRLTEEMQEYRIEHEKMLFSLALAGAAFKKVYFDPNLGRQASVFIPAEDFIMPFTASNVFDAYRKTHKMRKTENELKRLMVSGLYRDVDLGDPVVDIDEVYEKKSKKEGFSINNDDRHTIYEVHCEKNIEGFEDEDDIALPYIITVCKASGKVLSVYRNWAEDDELKRPQQYFVGYNYVVGFGAYGLGLIHLVGALCSGATSLLRQLVDAGTLSNLPGGFKTRGMRVSSSDVPIRPGEFRDVDVASGNVKDNVITLPYKEPSQVLLALMNQIIEDSRRASATADLKISDMSAQAPVGTTLALLERQLKVMSAVQARVHHSMKQEFKLLKKVIRDYTSDNYEYDNDTSGQKGRDYDMVEVIPVSDPSASTMSQRIAQAQAALQLAQTTPTVYDLPKLHRNILESIGYKNAAEFVPLPEDKVKTPKDPVTENMSSLIGKPLKAYKHQDHQAHLAAHQSFLQDPKIQMAMQMNPNAQAALTAHIQEHVAYQYQRDIEAKLGVAIPEGEALPPQMELQMSGMMAQAAMALAQENAQAAQAQQAQQAAQDPVVQMQQADLQLKTQELQRKVENDKLDHQVALERLRLDAERMAREDQRSRLKLQADNSIAAADIHLRATKENSSDSAK